MEDKNYDVIIDKVIKDMKINYELIDGDTNFKIDFPPWLSKNHSKKDVDYIVHLITNTMIECIGLEPKKVIRQDHISDN